MLKILTTKIIQLIIQLNFFYFLMYISLNRFKFWTIYLHVIIFCLIGEKLVCVDNRIDFKSTSPLSRQVEIFLV